MQYEELKSRVVKGFAWQGLSKGFGQLLGWASTIIVASILTPDDYGLVAIQGVFVAIALLFCEGGITNGLINMREVNQDVLDGVFYFMFLFSVLLYCLLYMLAPFIANIYGDERIITLTRISGLLVVITSFKSVPLAIAMRKLAYRYRSILEICSLLISVIVVLVLSLNGYGYWSLILSTLAKNLVETVGYMVYLNKIPKFVFPIRNMKEVFVVGAKMLAARALYTLSRQADSFFLGLYGGVTALGYYNLAFSLASLPIDKIGSVFNQIAFPAFSRIQSQAESSKSLYLSLHKYLLLIGIPLLVGGVFIAEDAIPLILGDKWTPIIFPFQVMLILNVLRLSEMFSASVLVGIGGVNLLLRYRIIAVIFYVPAFFMGSKDGINGMLVAWMAVFPVLYCVLLCSVIKQSGVSFRAIVASNKAAFSSILLMSGVLYLVFETNDYIQQPFLSLSSKIVVGALIYGSSIWLFFRKDFDNFISLSKKFN